MSYLGTRQAPTSFAQLTADACELPVVAGPVAVAAYGNVLFQARTAGVLTGGLAELRHLLHAATTYLPGGLSIGRGRLKSIKTSTVLVLIVSEMAAWRQQRRTSRCTTRPTCRARMPRRLSTSSPP
jgi:hypothetical protein